MTTRNFLPIVVTVVLVLFTAGASAYGAADQPDDGMSLDNSAPIYEAPPADSLDLTDEVTLEAWVKANAMPAGGGGGSSIRCLLAPPTAICWMPGRATRCR